MLDEEALPIAIEPMDQSAENQQSFVEDIGIGEDLPLEAVEKATILRTLESSDGNKSEAARRLGITRKTLHKKLKKYGVMP